MKKRNLVMAATLMLGCLMLAGCGLGDLLAPFLGLGGGGGDSSTASLPLPAPSGSVPPAASSASRPESEPEEDLTPFDAALLERINAVLAGYADGSLPIPIQYHTEFYGIQAALPFGVALPEKARMRDVTYTREFDEMYGAEYIEAVLRLEDDYSLTVNLRLDGEGEAAMPDYASGAWFTDDAGTAEFDALPAPTGGSFTAVSDDRAHGRAGFTGLQAPDGATLSGYLNWEKGGLLWLNYEQGFFYTYYVSEAGAFTQDYPIDEFREINGSPYSDEQAMEYARFIYEQYISALENA